jgi:DNA ligase-1
MFSPTLAITAKNEDVLYPCIASPKLDGLRGLIHIEGLRSRSMKPFTNVATVDTFSIPEFLGFDGELVVGSPTAKDVFIKSTSGLRTTINNPGAVFYVFDLHSTEGAFIDRWKILSQRVESLPEHLKSRVVLLEQRWIENLEQLLAYEDQCLEQGYEGLIIRNPQAKYLNGRSGLGKNWVMLKLKRFTDSEAELVGMIELMVNDNAAQTNELGNTFHSSHKEGLKPGGMMGALLLRDLTTGVEFSVGTGFDHKTRKKYWSERGYIQYDGVFAGQKVVYYQHQEAKIIKYKYFAIGYDKVPRFPVYLGERLPVDL